jgi:uncharacterized protein with beta-barrel porin domain
MGRILNTGNTYAVSHSSKTFQAILLGSVSVLAFGMVLAGSPSATAQTITPASTSQTVDATGPDILVNPGVNLTGSPAIEVTANTGTINNQGVVGSAAIAGGIYNNASTLNLLSNFGTIASATFAIYNDSGTIGTLTNSGLVSAASHAAIANNGGTIQCLTNLGTLSGSTGIYNSGGLITTLTNGTLGQSAHNGTISAIVDVSNSGTIAAFTNDGWLLAQNTGINNYRSIASLTNSGTILATENGISNFKNIQTLNNNGNIFGQNKSGVDNNGGTIAALTNGTTATISGYNGVENFPSTIGVLTNDGTIAGSKFGIYNRSSFGAEAYIGTLTNAGLISSTISAAIANDGGAIQSLTNLGTISGNTGITTRGNGAGGGFISTLTNGSLGQSANSAIIFGTTNGTIIGGNTGIADTGTGSIGMLTNAGFIAGGNNGHESGIFNSGQISVIDNTGTIGEAYTSTGNFDLAFNGIYNTGDIGQLTNNNLVIGDGVGIQNGGTINNLDNTNTISGGTSGIYNNGEITTLANSGLITGTSGIYNNGVIATLTNSGLITGQNIGIIDEAGSIATLTNAATGTISAVYEGLLNYSNIGTLANAGLIAGRYGVDNFGTIGALNNNGGIMTGTTAIYSRGGNLGMLTNTGLISGNVQILNQDLNIIGGTGSNFGTLTGGNIMLTAGNNLNLSGNEILTDNVFATNNEMIALAVSPLVTPTSTNPAIGTLTNSGTLQLGNPGQPANITITGNYAQTGAGTLNVIVTPKASSQMTVEGNASLAGGVDYIFAPGTYSPKTYSFILIPQGDGTITGAFATANYDGTPNTSTTYSMDPAANLVLGSGFSFPISTPTTVSPTDSSIFSAQTQALSQAAQRASASLLGIAATGGTAAAPACEGQVAPNRDGMSGDNIAAAMAAELCNAGGWIQADGSLGHVSGGDGASADNANSAGFLAGIDKLFGAIRLGVAVGYDETYLSDKSGGKGDMGTTRLALYGAQSLGRVTLTGVIGYGYASNNTTRATGIGSVKENNNLNILSGAIQARTVYALPGYEIIPAAGIRYAYLGDAHFTEAAGQNNAFALTGRTKNFNSLQPYVTAELTTSYATMSGYKIAPQATFGVQDEAGDRGAASDLTAADGTAFVSTHDSLAPLAAILGAGLSASKANLTLYIDYSGLIAGNWNTQTGDAGLRVTF